MTFFKPVALLAFLLFLSVGMHAQVMPVAMVDSVVTDTSSLVIPNVFSPNGDEINDYFEVNTDGRTVYDLSIFTRTGTRIFFSTSPRIFWDGRSNVGIEMKEGVYYYVIEESEDKASKLEVGFIHLYR